MSDRSGGFVTTNEEMAERWRDLAIYLMRDFVPAFRTGGKRGAPKQAHAHEPPGYPNAHAARLVQIVFALRGLLKAKDLPASKRDAFKRLVKILKKQPAPRWRYGRLQTVGAFEQEWKSIPKSIRENPDQYLPPLRSSTSAALDPVPLAKNRRDRLGPLRNFLREWERDMWTAIPPVPNELDG
jgi:hypothetical protein